jgi:hypothetical protein
MSEFSILKERVERLRKIHLRALASFNAFEQIQEYRAPNLIGKELAHKHAEAIGVYKGFFNTVEHALNTELHIAVAKLFDSHKDALHIEKLVNYAEQNQAVLTAAQQTDLDDDTGYSSELAKVYEGLNHKELVGIKADLGTVHDKITRLKTVRDKEVAHINVKKPEELKYLTYQEFVELISLSERILNLVSKKLYGDVAWFDNYRDQVIEDTKSLLALVGKSQGIFEKQADRLQ